MTFRDGDEYEPGYQQGRQYKTLVHRHFSEGGTGITNLSQERRAHFEKVLKAYGDPNLVLSSESLDGHPGFGGSLHDVYGSRDLSDFWHFVEAFKAEPDCPLRETESADRERWVKSDLMEQLRALEDEGEIPTL